MNLPDGPKTPPLIQLMEWVFTPLTYLERSAAQYGDCFTVHFLGFPPFVMIGNPQMIEQIFTAPAQLFDSGVGNDILRPTVGDFSVMLLDGKRHQRQRQLLMPPFHGERMRAYGELICQITEQVIDEQGIGKPFNARSVMQTISLTVILQAVFGLTQGDRYQKLRQLLSNFLEASTSLTGTATVFFPQLQIDLGPWSPFGKFLRYRAQIDELLLAEIHDRRQSPDVGGEDILSLLLMAKDDTGQGMSDQELRDELITLLIAGHETTATALTWALYWIHWLPTVKAQLLEELRSLGAKPNASAIVKLPYLNAVCSETLRLYPVALITFLRFLKEPLQILNYHFEAGAILAPNIYLTHQREDLYLEPRQFKPERFLERQFSPYEFLPFGGSNRRCLGAAFALFEMKLVLATMLAQYELVLVNKRPVRPGRRGVTLAPANPVQVTVTSQRQTLPEPAVKEQPISA